VQRKSIGFHQDGAQEWGADLACGYQQHVRHTPPWLNGPWVVSPTGRRSRLGYPLDAQCRAMWRRAKMVARGTSRPRKGSRLCKR